MTAINRKRHHRTDPGHFETLGLDADQLVPVLAQLVRASSAGIARAGDGRFQPEIREGSEILAGDAVGVEMKIDEHPEDATMWHGLGRKEPAA